MSIDVRFQYHCIKDPSCIAFRDCAINITHNNVAPIRVHSYKQVCFRYSQFLVCCIMDKGISNHVFAKHQLIIQRHEGRRFPTVSSYESPVFGWIHIHGIITEWSIDCDGNAILHGIVVGFQKLDIKVTASKYCCRCVVVVLLLMTKITSEASPWVNNMVSFPQHKDASVSSITLMSQEVFIWWRVEEEAARRGLMRESLLPSFHHCVAWHRIPRTKHYP